MNTLRVVLGIDSIAHPLTGVGRYTYELARRLAFHAALTEVRWLRGTSLVDSIDSPTLSDFTNARRRLRHVFGGMPGAQWSRDQMARHAARRIPARSVYHNPNFLLPPGLDHGVVTVHDLSVLDHPQFHPAGRVSYMSRRLERSIERATHVISVSDHVRKSLVTRFGLAPEKVTTISLGVALSPYRSAAALAAGLRALGLRARQYLLSVATFEPRKNHATLLDAYQALPDALRQRFPLVLAGAPGWHSDRLLRRIEASARRGDVRMLGFVSDETRSLLYTGARAFVFPSWDEGFGLPVLEAQAAGLPVVCSNVSSLPEIVGQSALLVDPGNCDALATAMRQVLEDDALALAMGAAGQANSTRFSLDRCADETVAVYGSVSRQLRFDA